MKSCSSGCAWDVFLLKWTGLRPMLLVWARAPVNPAKHKHSLIIRQFIRYKEQSLFIWRCKYAWTRRSTLKPKFVALNPWQLRASAPRAAPSAHLSRQPSMPNTRCPLDHQGHPLWLSNNQCPPRPCVQAMPSWPCAHAKISIVHPLPLTKGTAGVALRCDLLHATLNILRLFHTRSFHSLNEIWAKEYFASDARQEFQSLFEKKQVCLRPRTLGHVCPRSVI